MKTQTKFRILSKDELLKLSSDELKAYVKRLKAEVKKLEAETAVIKEQTKKDRLENVKLQAKLEVWQELNKKELRRLGWEDLTEEEITWLMTDDNFRKEWPIFKPSGARAIKERYAERMKKPVDNVLDKKFAADPKMEVPSGWVDRSGNYFPVGVAEHDKWAWDYLTKQYGPQEAGKKVGPGAAHEVLEKAGWVRVMKWPSLDVQFILPRSLSHAQKQTIDRYCSIYKVKLPFEDDLF